jgi:hypothetical protein
MAISGEQKIILYSFTAQVRNVFRSGEGVVIAREYLRTQIWTKQSYPGGQQINTFCSGLFVLLNKLI